MEAKNYLPSSPCTQLIMRQNIQKSLIINLYCRIWYDVRTLEIIFKNWYSKKVYVYGVLRLFLFKTQTFWAMGVCFTRGKLHFLLQNATIDCLGIKNEWKLSLSLSYQMTLSGTICINGTQSTAFYSMALSLTG